MDGARTSPAAAFPSGSKSGPRNESSYETADYAKHETDSAQDQYGADRGWVEAIATCQVNTSACTDRPKEQPEHEGMERRPPGRSAAAWHTSITCERIGRTAGVADNPSLPATACLESHEFAIGAGSGRIG